MAVDMFLKIDRIEGESNHKNHKGEIEILSFSWGATNPGASSGGAGGGSGKVVLQDFHFVHRVDKSSPLLMNAICDGRHLPAATLSIASNQGKGGKGDFLKIKLTDILVSSVRPGASTAMDDVTLEAVSLNFNKIEMNYYAPDGEIVGGSASSQINND